MSLTFSVSPSALTRYTGAARVCDSTQEIRSSPRGPTNTSTKRVRTNNGAPVSPILMLCEGELSARQPSHASSPFDPPPRPDWSFRVSPSLLSLPPFDRRPAPSTSPPPTISWLRYTLRAPSQRAIEGLSCRRVARYILFISAATTKPRALAAAAFTGFRALRFVSERVYIGAPNSITPETAQ